MPVVTNPEHFYRLGSKGCVMNYKLLRWSLLFLLITSFAFAQSSFWVPTAGPLRISVSALALNSQGHVYAGTYTKGMYRSTDNGTSWVQINNGLPEARIYSIGISRSPRNHDNIFVATHGAGVYRSTNNGERWYRVGFNDTSKYIESIAIDIEGNVFASAHHIWYDRSTLYRSTDNGSYWEVAEINNPLVNTATISLLVPTSGKYNGKVFAGTNWGVYRSVNAGDDWERMVPVGTNFEVNSIAINFKGEIYAAASDSSVYKSVDSGMTWSKSKVTNDKVLSLIVNPNGVLFAATYGSGMYRSLDDGKTWHSLQSGLDNELMLCVAYADAGDYST
ncbi:MAG: hypothetical protein HYZ34_11345, partial [Ignavibacteriae bacterium]|nr:hypothetical protein [Ignavibacteriota bacterium]